MRVTSILRLASLLFVLTTFIIQMADAQTSANHKPNIEPDEFTARSPSIGWDEGMTVPNVSFTDVNRKKAKLHDLLDKPVLLEFWTVESEQCKKNKRYLKSFYKQYNLNIVGICTSEYPNQIRKMGLDQQLDWSNVYDDSKKFNGKTFAETLELNDPKFILIGADKKVETVLYSENEIGKLGVMLQQYFANN